MKLTPLGSDKRITRSTSRAYDLGGRFGMVQSGPTKAENFDDGAWDIFQSIKAGTLDVAGGLATLLTLGRMPAVTDYFAGKAQDQIDAGSPALRKALSKDILSLSRENGVIFDGKAVANIAARLTPSLAPAFGAAGVAAKSAKLAGLGTRVATKTAGLPAIGRVGARLGKMTSTAGGRATLAGTGAGAVQTAGETGMAASLAAKEAGATEQERRNAATMGLIGGGVVGAGAGALIGKTIAKATGDIATKAVTRPGRIAAVGGTGALAEGIEEGAGVAAGQAAASIATGKNLMDVREIIEEGVVGAAVGGAIGGAAGATGALTGNLKGEDAAIRAAIGATEKADRFAAQQAQAPTSPQNLKDTADNAAVRAKAEGASPQAAVARAAAGDKTAIVQDQGGAAPADVSTTQAIDDRAPEINAAAAADQQAVEGPQLFEVAAQLEQRLQPAGKTITRAAAVPATPSQTKNLKKVDAETPITRAAAVPAGQVAAPAGKPMPAAGSPAPAAATPVPKTAEPATIGAGQSALSETSSAATPNGLAAGVAASNATNAAPAPGPVQTSSRKKKAPPVKTEPVSAEKPHVMSGRRAAGGPALGSTEKETPSRSRRGTGRKRAQVKATRKQELKAERQRNAARPTNKTKLTARTKAAINEEKVDRAKDRLTKQAAKRARTDRASTRLQEIRDTATKSRTPDQKGEASISVGDLATVILNNSEDRTQRKVARQLQSLAPTTRVFLVDRDFLNSRGIPEDLAGAFIQDIYSGKGEIYVDVDQPGASITALHEAIHAHTVPYIQANKLPPVIQEIFDYFRAENPGTYASESPVEFIAEAFSNPRVQRILRGKVAPVDGKRVAPRKGAWSRFLGWLGRITGFTPTDLDRIFQARATILEAQEQLNKRASDKLAQLPEGDLQMIAMHGMSLSAQQNQLRQLRNSTARFFTDSEFMKQRKRQALEWLTGDQIAEYWGDQWLTEDGNSLLRDYNETVHDRDGAAHRYQKESTRLNARWMEWERGNPDEAQALNELLGDGSRMGMDASKLPPKSGFARQELNRRYKALPEPAQKLYRDLLATYRKARADRIKVVRNRMREHFDVAADVKVDLNTEKGIDAWADAVRARAGSDVPGLENAVRVLNELNKVGQREGYVPFLRNSDGYGVDVRVNLGVREFVDQDALDRARFADPTLVIEGIVEEEGRLRVDLSRRFFSVEPSVAAAEARRAEALELFREGADKTGLHKRAQAKLKAPNPDRFIPEALDGDSDSGRTLAVLKEKIGRDSEEAKMLERVFIELLPEGAIQQRSLERKGVYGYRTDMRQVFAQQARAQAFFNSEAEFGPKLRSQFSELEKFRNDRMGEAGALDRADVLEVMRLRRDADHKRANPHWLARAANMFNFFSFLVSPAFVLMNVAQPWLTSVPIIVQRFDNGWKHTQDAMNIVHPFSAMWDRGKGTWAGLKEFKEIGDTINNTEGMQEDILNRVRQDDPKLAKFLQRMVDQGLIDQTLDQELRRSAEPPGIGGTWAQQKLATTMEASAAMPRLVEIANRNFVAIATYNAALEKHNGDVAKAEYEARKMLSETMGNYGASNKSLAFQGMGKTLGAGLGSSWAPLIFQFKTYLQFMIMTYGRYALGTFRAASSKVKGVEVAEADAEAAKVFGTMMAALWTVAGTNGMMFQPLMAVIAPLLWLFSDEEDDGLSVEDKLAKWTGDSLLSRTIRQGPVTAILGLDTASRMGFQDALTFYEDRGGTAEEEWSRLAMSLLGPSVGNLMSMARGAEQASQGRYWDAQKNLLPWPKAITDLMTVGGWAWEGGVTDSKGDLIMPMEGPWTPLEYTYKILGFSPTAITDFYNRRSRTYGVMNTVEERRTMLNRHHWEAKGTDADQLEVEEEIRVFNEWLVTKGLEDRQITRKSLKLSGDRLDRAAESKRKHGLDISEKKEGYLPLAA